MLNLTFLGFPTRLQPGLEEVLPELSICCAPDGIPVTVTKGDCLRATLTADGGAIVYRREVEIFRALAHLSREGIGCDIIENACFDCNGLMLDCSRNAVTRPEMVRLLLRRMALMGLDLLMLYTEDTFEVENYPYFGYQRQGYTKAELRALDDYAYALGVEMCPCIQTLGHHWMMTRWTTAMSEITDVGGVLLVGEEKTYQYLEQLLKDASEPYRSRRIHIGMDECGGLGQGQYRAKNGSRPAIDVFQEHIGRVRQLTRKLGLEPMIWTDMYFALTSPTHDYCADFELPEGVLKLIPKDMGLVYWDYYRHDQTYYESVIAQHQRAGAEVLFAGGLWNWASCTVNYDYMLSTSLPALRACKTQGIRQVFATAWGDEGAQSSLLGIQYGLQVYAEFGYTGEYDPAETGRRFQALVGAEAKAFLDLAKFDMIPGAKQKQDLAPNPSFYLLYEDPSLLQFEKDLEGQVFADHYMALHKEYARYQAECKDDALRLTWEFYSRLALVMAEKCRWRETAPEVVRRKDRKAAEEMAELAQQLSVHFRELSDTWYRMWMLHNKAIGWEVLDLRLGGLEARFRTMSRQMDAFAKGELETLPEYEIEKLPYAPAIRPQHSVFGGAAGFFGPWQHCATINAM